MSANPYSMIFGQIPTEMVSRLQSVDTVINSFLHDNPKQQVFMVTGIRGSGKTVFMTEVSRIILGDRDFTGVDLNSEGNLLEDLYARLLKNNSLKSIFKSANISLSIAGIGINASGSFSKENIKIEIESMLKAMKKHGKKLLITIDEVVNTPDMRIFISEFQHYLREDYPVYLLMTGLYKNISLLQNEKTLTFLYRAPKIMMEPLNLGAMAENYKRNIKLDSENAIKMAKMTEGYSLAFQVLGSLTYEKDGDFEKVMPDFRQYLEEYSYEKIWSELSKMDKDVIISIAKIGEGNNREVKISDIRDALGISANNLNQYRKRLIRQGIISSPQFGYVRIILPSFSEFALENE